MPKIIDEGKVFAAVMNLVVAQGYGNATTKELAAVAGIHEATLFRKYESKAKLVLRAIHHHLVKAPVSDISYTGDLVADLTAIVQSYIESDRLYGAVVSTILIEAPRYPELAEALNLPFLHSAGMAAILQRYQDQGALVQEHPLHSLNVLIGPLMIQYLFRRASADLPAPPPPLDPRAYVEMFLSGRRPSSSV